MNNYSTPKKCPYTGETNREGAEFKEDDMNLDEFCSLGKDEIPLSIIFPMNPELDLAKIKTKEERSYSSSSSGQNIVSLDDCISQFSTEELLKEENQVYC